MRGIRNRLACAFACLAVLGLSVAPAEEAGLPDGYRYVGSYLISKRIKVREEGPLVVALKPCMVRVFTDGISVRIYGEEMEESFTEFSIYRNDGVFVSVDGESVEPMPGVQASSSVGDVLRQLTLTEDRLVLTKFPALSDVVEITYANRRISLNRNSMK